MDTLEALDPSRAARSDARGRRPRKCRNVIDVAADEGVLECQYVEEERRRGRPELAPPPRISAWAGALLPRAVVARRLRT